MKKNTIFFIVATALISICLFFLYYIDKGIDVTILATPEETSLSLSTQETSAPQIDTRHNPIFKDDRIFVPIESIISGLKGAIATNIKEISIEVEKLSLTLYLDETKARLNGYDITIESAPFLYNDILYIDAEMIAKYLNATYSLSDDENGNRWISFNANKPNSPLLFSHNINESNPDYEISYRIPVIVNVTDKKYEQYVNKSISENANERINNFVHDAISNANPFRFKIESSYECSVFNQDFISVYIDEIVENHEYKSIYTRYSLNYDITMQKLLTLKDIFKIDDYRERLPLLVNDEIILDDYSEENFYFEKDNLIIYNLKIQNSDMQDRIKVYKIPLQSIQELMNSKYIF